jgi:hypothetical protein
MKYKIDDKVLPLLHLDKKKSVKIEITVTDKEVSLQIDRRDWQWDRATGEMIGCGTTLR